MVPEVDIICLMSMPQCDNFMRNLCMLCGLNVMLGGITSFQAYANYMTLLIDFGIMFRIKIFNENLCKIRSNNNITQNKVL